MTCCVVRVSCVKCARTQKHARTHKERQGRAVLRIATAVSAMVGLAVLGLILSASVTATAVIFGVFAGVVVGLAVANLRREFGPPRPQGPQYYITNTHQHLHVYPPAEPPQVTEPERRVITIEDRR